MSPAEWLMNVHSLISVVGCAGAGSSDLSKRSNDSEETHQSPSFISANARHTIEDDSPCFPTITAHTSLTANVQAERPASYLVLPFTPQALLLGQEDVLSRLKTSSLLRPNHYSRLHLRDQSYTRLYPTNTYRRGMTITPTKGNGNGRPSFSLPTIREEALPPLPLIQDPNITRRVFIHRSYYARPTHIFQDPSDDPSPDNEMLEHLGDSVLSLAVTSLLRQDFPYLRVGPSTKIRALLVRNTTLASLSVAYKLPERLITHTAQTVTLQASTNIQADLFEAYVGGVYEDSGLDAVKAWLFPLFRMYTDQAYRFVRVQHGLPESEYSPPTFLSSSNPLDIRPHMTDPSSTWSSPPPARQAPNIGHLSLFNQHLQQQNKDVEWVYADSVNEGTKTTPIWVVRAMIGTECYGRGRGSTKKAAKNEAAKQGLQKLGVIVPQGEVEIGL